MIASYPVANTSAFDAEAERVMESVIEVIRSIRNARAEHKIAASKWIEARIYSDKLQSAIASKSAIIEALARARPVAVLSRDQRQTKEERAVVQVLKEAEVVLPWAGMVDLSAERQRLEKEINFAQEQVARLEHRLKDSDFVSKAPAMVVTKERDKLQDWKDKLHRLKQELAQLS